MIYFMGYDEKKLVQIVDEWERSKWDAEMLAAKEAKLPTKHIMTRAEAIALITQHMPKIFDPASVIDFYVAAGMLEIKEENPISQILANLPFLNMDRSDIIKVISALIEKGYITNNS